MSGVQDPQVYEEACAVLGQEGARAWLDVFRKDLADHLTRVEEDRCDPGSLQDIAHRTAGRAGLLGFRALADASASLDDAMRRNKGIAAALDHWVPQARLALDIPPDDVDAPAQDGTGDSPTR